jgi:AraC family transcriptional regulator, activator of mtrCDE
MQKRAKIAIQFAPIGLEDNFPFLVTPPYEQHDLPIRHLHFHQCLELGLCDAGNGIFVIGDRVLPFGAGDVSFIAANQVHLARSAPGTISRWTWIYLDLPRLLPAARDANWDMILPAAQHPRVASLVAQMIEEARCEYSDSCEMLRALAWQLSLEIARVAPDAAGRKSLPQPDYNRISPALARLAGSLSRGETARVSVGELAQICHLSEAHFRRLFKATMGRTPREYAFDLQMRLATSLLRGTSKPILAIAQDCGFLSLSSFNRVFKRTFGKAPRDWRRAIAIENNES